MENSPSLHKSNLFPNLKRCEHELRMIRATTAQHHRSLTKSINGNTIAERPLWQHMAKANVYRPFIVLVLLFLFQQMSGIYAIIFYAVNLCTAIGTKFGGINEYMAMLFINITRFVFIIVNVM